MRRILIFIFCVLLLSCTKKTVYRTYYGSIDTDTMSVADVVDYRYPCYLVHSSDKDSTEVVPGDGDWVYIDGPIYIYYCPQKDTYYKCFPDCDGNMLFVGYNPKDHSCFNPMSNE